MSRRLPISAGLFAATLLSAPLAVLPAFAQGQKSPAKPGAAAQAPAPAPAAPAAPAEPEISPSHLALAREVMLNSGISRSFDSIIPAFAEQIKRNAITRPELTKDLDEVLKSLEPEAEMQKQRMVDIAAKIYAKRLSEAELKDVVAFFRSPSGKRYVETQPQVLDDLVGAMQDWSQEVSEYMMVRVRVEMGKRGHQLQ